MSFIRVSTKRNFRFFPPVLIHPIALAISLILLNKAGWFIPCVYAEELPSTERVNADLSSGQNISDANTALPTGEIQFNTEVLDLDDRANIDLSRFSQAGYVMPGTYTLGIQIGKSNLPEREIQFLAPDDNPKGSQACLTKDMVSLLGLTSDAERKITWWHKGECLDPASLKGMSLRADLGTETLYVNLPQAYLEYTADNWDPPSRWDEGISGAIFDYSINAQMSHQAHSENANQKTVSGNGVTGMNFDAWRLRADWQANYDHASGATDNQQSWQWNRYYLYRAIGSIRSKLTLGEDYLNSGMFDSFRYTGASLVSDDNMLPPNLRGYAPEVTGVAKTNAKVTISQQGRVIYETSVAAGPFRIQDLNNAVTGKLDVKVTEQDGSINTFQVDTASVPYLTRPGLVRYKLASGKPSDYKHHAEGPVFNSGEFSWGVSNGWSLYSGAILAGDYNALAAGIGRDLLVFGAVSLDITRSRASLPQEGLKQGGSYRLSYSKRFDSTNSQVTFAGYRFSERNFMNMSQYLDARFHSNYNAGAAKELYTLMFNQQLQNLNMTAYINYNHQTYWDRPANDTYNFSTSRYFDWGRFKNLSLSLSAYRTKYNGKNDDGVYLSLAIPWGESGTLSYDAQVNKGNNSNSVGYNDRIDENTAYRLSAGVGQGTQSSGSGYITHAGEVADMSATAAYQGSEYTSMGMSLSGGVTTTLHGVALHRTGSPGVTRMMVDTGGISGVPVKGYGVPVRSNIFGKAVLSDMSSYYRNTVSIDLGKLNDNVEATRSVAQDTLTEGAIGYRKFGVIAGEKAMAILRLADGSSPPFGSIVLNKENEQTGIVSDDGNVWLTGIKSGEVMQVSWSGQVHCHITLPKSLPQDLESRTLLLPCILVDKDNEKKLLN